MALSVGSGAPNFTLHDTGKKPVSLSDFAGKKVVLLFYPAAFSGVCDKEMCSFRDSMAHYNTLKAQIIGISVDGPWANKAFSEKYNLQFPLLSDYTRYVSAQYAGLFVNFGGMPGYAVSNRAAFVVNEKGSIAYAWVGEAPGNEPPYDEIKKAVG
jgi:peroxiredoxin